MNQNLENCIQCLCGLESVKEPVQAGQILKEHLGKILAQDNLLTPEQTQYDPSQNYTKHIIYNHCCQDSPWSIHALVWKPASFTPLHDHCCWCTFGVYQGSIIEERYQKQGDQLNVVSSQKLEKGDFDSIVPNGNDIHQMRNSSDEVAISLHFYGINTELKKSSISCCY